MLPKLQHVIQGPATNNLLYDTRHALDEYGVLNGEEATTFARLLFAKPLDHGRLHAALGPAIDVSAAWRTTSRAASATRSAGSCGFTRSCRRS